MREREANESRTERGPIWFEPTRYAYGSDAPTGWQGWTVLGVFVAAILGAGLLASRSLAAYFSLIATLVTLLCVICAKTTRGGWRWRWGDKDE